MREEYRVEGYCALASVIIARPSNLNEMEDRSENVRPEIKHKRYISCRISYDNSRNRKDLDERACSTLVTLSGCALRSISRFFILRLGMVALGIELKNR